MLKKKVKDDIFDGDTSSDDSDLDIANVNAPSRIYRRGRKA